MVTSNVQLVRQLGEGGMGSVWVADHLGLDTQVAVKFISAELAKDEQMRERFSREAKATAQIKSPHVVHTLDHGFMPDGTPYIVMELLRGASLADRLQLEGRLDFAEVVQVVHQVASVLERAHADGIVHRDIKPANVFLVGSENETFVKVLDFGIAKRTERRTGEALTATGVMVGTPEYMSPEQVLSARDVDHRADLWALAVLAYEALSGVRPFEGETVGALCVSIARAKFLPPSQMVAGLPPELDGWFARAFDKQRSARFQSAPELAEAFERAARFEPGNEVERTSDLLPNPDDAGGPSPSGVIGPGLRGATRRERVPDSGIAPAVAPSLGPGLSGAGRRGLARRSASRGEIGTPWDGSSLDSAPPPDDGWRDEREVAAARTGRSATQPLPRRQRSSASVEIAPPLQDLPPPESALRSVPAAGLAARTAALRGPGGAPSTAVRARRDHPDALDETEHTQQAGVGGAAGAHARADLGQSPPRRKALATPLELAPRRVARQPVAGAVRVQRGPTTPGVSPTAMGSAALIVLGTMLFAAYLEPAGVASLQRLLGKGVYVGYGVAAIVLLVGAKLVGDAGRRSGSLWLALATLGLLTLAACLGVTAVGLTGTTVDIGPLRPVVRIATPLSAASVALGLSSFGLLRAREELFGSQRRVAIGVLLAVLSTASVAAAARMVERSPLFQHDDALDPPRRT